MRGWGLQGKFLLAVSAMMIVVMAGVGAAFLRRERRMIISAMENKGVLLARELAIASADKVATNDFSELAHYVDEVRQDPDIAYVYIFEDLNKTCVAAVDAQGSHAAEGRSYASFTDETSRAAFAAADGRPRRCFLGGRSAIDIAAPIVIGSGSRYGLVRVGLTLDGLRAELARTRNTVLAILLVSVILGVIVSGFLARIILGPVSALVLGVDAVSVGDFTHHIDVPTGDELGQLADAFNRMTHNISVLYNVSSAMNFIADTDKLLNLILDKALEAIAAQRGSILLLDEAQTHLQVKVVRGLSESSYRFLRIPVGEGIAGEVARTGQPLIVNAGSADPRFKSFPESVDNERKILSLLCVPLRMEDKTLGCINVVNKTGGGEFNQDDAKLLTVLASQAAVTLNKARLYEESITDGLTKLFIRRYFQIRLEEELKRAKRYGSRITLIMLDLDHFKALNDSCGHQQGDLVLRRTAELMRESIRESLDVPCRYGGEEFVIIMPETERPGALAVAERLRARIEAEEFSGQPAPVRITVSLGMAQYPDDADDAAALIKRADTALYYAKEHGRNRTAIYESSMAAAR
ncbi:MAG: diguanylate cyclase [Elusimicrobia bacterium]|nr:diguanylate cyclase [Elusimicrobiota bacterium]